MKKCIRAAAVWMVVGMVFGVIAREVTKATGYTWEAGFKGSTVLFACHPHALALGMGGMLLFAVLTKVFALEAQKGYTAFFITYNASLAAMLIMLFIQGMTQVLNITSPLLLAVVAGISGLTHIALFVSMVLFFRLLWSVGTDKE